MATKATTTKNVAADETTDGAYTKDHAAKLVALAYSLTEATAKANAIQVRMIADAGAEAFRAIVDIQVAATNGDAATVANTLATSGAGAIAGLLERANREGLLTDGEVRDIRTAASFANRWRLHTSHTFANYIRHVAGGDNLTMNGKVAGLAVAAYSAFLDAGAKGFYTRQWNTDGGKVILSKSGEEARAKRTDTAASVEYIDLSILGLVSSDVSGEELFASEEWFGTGEVADRKRLEALVGVAHNLMAEATELAQRLDVKPGQVLADVRKRAKAVAKEAAAATTKA